MTTSYEEFEAAPSDTSSPPRELVEPPCDQHAVHAPHSDDQHTSLELDGFVLDESSLVNSSLLPYLAMLASLLEGRSITREQLLQLLRERMRQRSIARLLRREYVLRYLQQHPP